MKEIDNLLAPIYLNNTIHKLKVSLDEIKQKHPNRKDLIDSMTESIEQLKSVLITFRNIELENRSLNKNLFNYQRYAMDLKINNTDLEKQNENFRKNIEL
jgi:hypothetical protein